MDDDEAELGAKSVGTAHSVSSRHSVVLVKYKVRRRRARREMAR